MPIDKLIPRKLNSDIDAKLVDKASMLDALNLYAGDDEDGGHGVLKNVKGNTQVAQIGADAFGENSRVIGSVVDEKTNIAYFFVFSSSGANHGVWAYDPDGKLANDGVEAVRLIYKSPQFNFDSDGFVKGDIVHINSQTLQEGRGDEFDTDAVIFFTDNKNEPRKINAYRAYVAGGSSIYGDGVFAEADFITACPKAPLDPITFTFDRDPNRKTSNFKGTSGYQFAYQHVYKDGFESSVSVYSDVAFPPSVINQGALSNASHDSYNRCILYIPQPGPEIDSVKILVKEGVNGSFLFIDEVKRNSLFDNGSYVGVYSFYDDRVAKGFSKFQVNKQFDSVPRKAQAQAVADNRLMYGNYLDGFDNVNVNCTAQVVYRQRPDDFVDLTINTNSFIGLHAEQSNADGEAKRKSSGFTIDTSSLPDSIISGASILVKVTMTPDQNWHIYNADNSYHQSSLIGEYEQTPISVAWNEYNNNSDNYQLQNDVDSGIDYLRGISTSSNGNPMLLAGDNDGVGASLYWKKKYDPDGETNNQSYPVRLGTSAANPIILKGGTLLFQVGFTTSTQVNSGFAIIASKTIEELFLGVSHADLTHKSFVQESTIIQSIESTLTHSLPLSNNSIIGQNYFGQVGGNDMSKMIMAVLRTSSNTWCPTGYVIFKDAKAKFGLKQIDDSETNAVSTTKKAFRLALLELTDVKPMTCYKSTLYGTGNGDVSDYPFLNSWGVIDPEVEFYDDEGNEKEFDPDAHFGYYGGSISIDDLQLDQDNPIGNAASLGALSLFKNMIGMLRVGGFPIFDFEIEDSEVPCVFDGEGGPGGGPSRGGGNGTLLGGNIYDNLGLIGQGSIPACTPFVYDPFSISEALAGVLTLSSNGEGWWSTIVTYNLSPMFSGRIHLHNYNATYPFVLSGYSMNYKPTVLPLLQNKATIQSIGANTVDRNWVKFPSPMEDSDNLGVLDVNSVNFNFLHSNVELESFVSGSYSGDVFRSFKSNSNHDFGVVYYDERGRHGGVNYLANVFVPGLSSLDRPDGSEGGPASVALTLNHAPPSWAHYFKIVYGGNSTIDRFIQYSVPNAYVRSYDTEDAPESNNIYVSLNYLQGNPISYVSSFGAKSIEGGISMYNFREGDKLRIISTGPNDSRDYYKSSDYEFDIVGLVDIAEPADNEDYSIVLVDQEGTGSDNVNPRLLGEFLVIKDNQKAGGFKYQDVTTGENKWKENCIVEIYSPSKGLGEDEKFYYETGSTYRVSKLNNQLVHAPSTVILNKGDVWFRKGALNWKEGDYVDLIPDSNLNEYKASSNFQSVFIESSTATDLHESDFKGFGRPNLIIEDAKEVRREASITYSDKTNPESSRPKFTSFNSTTMNYVDYDYKRGGISYLSPSSGYLVALQSGRVSIIPLSKNILSDASGSTNLISSNVVLGEAIPQEGVQGCDAPESVVERDDMVYYANKREAKIFLYKKGAGVKDLSTNVIGSSIRRALRDLQGTGKSKIIGGYDSLKEEYLITIIALSGIDVSGYVIVEQPVPGTGVTIGFGGVQGVEAEDGLGVTGFQVFIDTDGDGIVGLNEFILQSGLAGSDLPIAGPGQSVVNTSLVGLSQLASQIIVSDNSTIASALFGIGTAITSFGSNFDEEEVLAQIISTYSLENNLDIATSAGLVGLFSAAGLTESALIIQQGGGGEGGTGDLINPDSNYDLVAKLIENGTDGWQVDGVYAQDNVIVNQELLNVASVLGLAGPENSVMSGDINLDGIVGTADLLILLSQFTLPPPEPEPVDLNEVVFTINEGGGGAAGQSSGTE